MTADPSPARVAAERGRSERRNADRWHPSSTQPAEPASPVPALSLTAQHLGHWVEGIDHRGEVHRGRLDAIEIHADPQHRVILRIAPREPINESDGGGFFYGTFLSERSFDRDALVQVGALAAPEPTP